MRESSEAYQWLIVIAQKQLCDGFSLIGYKTPGITIVLYHKCHGKLFCAPCKSRRKLAKTHSTPL